MSDVPAPGVYVHVPFCHVKCPYCDFAAYAGKDRLVERYVAALAAELRMQAPLLGGRAATTVYLGGGTPSRIRPDQIAAVLAAVRAEVGLEPGAEVSLEANPEDVTHATLAGWVDAGVTRLSIGAQSFDPEVLRWLGRSHGTEEVDAALRLTAGSGCKWSLDLIFGAPVEDDASWARSVERAIDAGAPHISAYALTVEAGTALGRAVDAGASAAPEPDVQAARWHIARAAFEAAGLRRYEVSSWARPGAECRHNLGYWSGGPYLGIGCGAHSYIDGRRFWNPRTPETYLARIEAGRVPTAGEERLPDWRARLESLMLGLRRAEGVDARGAAPVWRAAAARPGLDRLVETRDGRVRLVDDGVLLADELFRELLALPARG